MKDSVGVNSLRRLSKRVLDQFGDYNHESKLVNMPKNLGAIEDELQLAAVQEQIQAKIAAQAQEKSRAGQEEVKSHLDGALKKFQGGGGAQNQSGLVSPSRPALVMVRRGAQEKCRPPR